MNNYEASSSGDNNNGAKFNIEEQPEMGVADMPEVDKEDETFLKRNGKRLLRSIAIGGAITAATAGLAGLFNPSDLVGRDALEFANITMRNIGFIFTYLAAKDTLGFLRQVKKRAEGDVMGVEAVSGAEYDDHGDEGK